MKRCPFCAEEIQDAAIVCKHCQRDLAISPAPVLRSPVPLPPRKGFAFAFKVIGIMALFALFMVAIAAWVLVREAGSRRVAVRTSTEPFVVLMHQGTRGIRITNDTERTWDHCYLEIAGGYSALFPFMNSRESVDVYYTSFSVDRTPLNEDDGYARAIRSTTLTCAGSDGQRHTAIAR